MYIIIGFDLPFKRGMPLIIISQYWLFLIIDISFLSKSVIGAFK